jgi:bacteriocin biosynthesis cyclodehydratase domain-containing protein
MVLRLDPAIAMIWRDPFSLQFGVEPARLVLREVSSAQERMIAALASGVSRSGLSMIATASGAEETDAAELLKRLDPLIESAPPAAPERTVAIVGRGPTVEQIATALAVAGVHVIASTSVPHSDCDLGVTVGHYVLDPESYGYWLRRDVPHLPVAFGDDSATVGPLVEPGVTACLYCIEYYRRDADRSWAAIASQLWGRRGGAETPLAVMEVAARVSRAVLRRLDGVAPTVATSVRIDVATGDTVARTWLPHPECGCIGMSAISDASDRALVEPSVQLAAKR